MVGERGRAGDLSVEAGGWWSDEMNGHGCRQMEAEFVRRYHRHQPRENQCSSTLVEHVKAPVHLVWSLVRRFDQPQKYKPFVSRCVVQGDLEIGSVREVNVKSGLPATTSTERLELLDDNEHILSIKIVGGDHRLRNLNQRKALEMILAQKDPNAAFVSCTSNLFRLLDASFIVSPVKEHVVLKSVNSGIDFVVDLLLLYNQNYSSVITVHPGVIDGRPGTLVIESFVVDVPDGNTKDETCYFVEALIKCNLKSLANVSERLAERHTSN